MSMTRAQMIATLQQSIGLSAETAAHIADIGLTTDTWQGLAEAINAGVASGEAWALEARWPDVAKIGR
ncbi:hypothetical protein ACGF0D_10680 [Kitasatospora sp. NPDC048298]|uniref:hypothetical protein n=1 Tax=Kitasatospora sp. NPDC048298 TaxID=3364049 RepID=UPI00370FB57C